jgi:hypothetical protein
MGWDGMAQRWRRDWVSGIAGEGRMVAMHEYTQAYSYTGKRKKTWQAWRVGVQVHVHSASSRPRFEIYATPPALLNSSLFKHPENGLKRIGKCEIRGPRRIFSNDNNNIFKERANLNPDCDPAPGVAPCHHGNQSPIMESSPLFSFRAGASWDPLGPGWGLWDLWR